MPVINSESSASEPLLYSHHPSSAHATPSESQSNNSDSGSTSLSGASSTTVQRRLFISHFLSTWNSRSFEFGATLFMAAAFPGSLLQVSVYAIARSAASIVFSGAVGRYIDRGERLSVVRNSIVYQRLATIISCALFLLLTIRTPPITRLRPLILAALCLFACVEKLASILNFVAIERDWVIVIASAAGSEAISEAVSEATSASEPVESGYHDHDHEGPAEVPAEVHAENHLQGSEPATEHAAEQQAQQTQLNALNARLRRIDLICKVAGPTLVALFDGGLGSRAAIAASLAVNVASLPVEYGAIARVWRAVPALATRREAEEDEEEEDDVVGRGILGECPYGCGDCHGIDGGEDEDGGEQVLGDDDANVDVTSGTTFPCLVLGRDDSTQQPEEQQPKSPRSQSHLYEQSPRQTTGSSGDAVTRGAVEDSVSPMTATRHNLDGYHSDSNKFKARVSTSSFVSRKASPESGVTFPAQEVSAPDLSETNTELEVETQTERTPLLPSQHGNQARRYLATTTPSSSQSPLRIPVPVSMPTSSSTSSSTSLSTSLSVSSQIQGIAYPCSFPLPSTPQFQTESNLTTNVQSGFKSCFSSIRTSSLAMYASLRAQACVYVGSAVLLPSLSLSLLYLNVLSFNGQTVTYLLSAGLTSWHIGLLRLAAICVELSATWAGPWLAGRIGAVRAGMWFVNWELMCLGLAVAYFFPRSIVDMKGAAVGNPEALAPPSFALIPTNAGTCGTAKVFDPLSAACMDHVTNGLSESSDGMLTIMMITTAGGWLQRAVLAMSGFPDWQCLAAAGSQGRHLRFTELPPSPEADLDGQLPLAVSAIKAAAAGVAEVAATRATAPATANAVHETCSPFDSGISGVIFNGCTQELCGAQNAAYAVGAASGLIPTSSTDPDAGAEASPPPWPMFRSTLPAPGAHSSVPPHPQALPPALKPSSSGVTLAVVPSGPGSPQSAWTDCFPGLPVADLLEQKATDTIQPAIPVDLNEMKRHGEVSLARSWEQDQLSAALVLVAGVILSRLGLWGFDLSAQSLVQAGVSPNQRGSFSTTEAALQNAFELMAFTSTAIWNRPAEFRFPVLASLVAIASSAALYAVFVRRRRGHLLHMPCGTARVDGGSKGWRRGRGPAGVVRRADHDS